MAQTGAAAEVSQLGRIVDEQHRASTKIMAETLVPS